MAMNSSLIEHCIHQLLEKKKCEFLSNNDIVNLLLSGSESSSEKSPLIGYPRSPLYKELAIALHVWATSRCPLLMQPSYNMLDDHAYMNQRRMMIDEVTPMLDGLVSLWDHWNTDEKCSKLNSILEHLGRRGMMDLLGLRKTVGTFDMWPPPRHLLEQSFCAKHTENNKSMLTVGARALAKHCHRDHSDSWWGKCTGSEEEKNQHAKGLLHRILDSATWINIHQLPHDVQIIEARHPDGYGVRWLADGSSFRGFLEPQMEDGHAVGWVH